MSDKDFETVARRLVMALADTRGDRGFNQADALVMVNNWRATMGWMEMYNRAIAGEIGIDVKDGEVVFMLPDGSAVSEGEGE